MCSPAFFLLASAALAPGALGTATTSHNADQPYKPLFVRMTGNNGYPFTLESLNPQLRLIDEDPSNFTDFLFCEWEASGTGTEELRLQFPEGSMVVSEGFWISEPRDDYNPYPAPKDGWEVGNEVNPPSKPGPAPDKRVGFGSLYIIADGVTFLLNAYVHDPSFIFTPTKEGPVVTLNILSEEQAVAQGYKRKGLNKSFVLFIGSGKDINKSAAQFLGA